jgi:hypothetical protein
MRSELDGEPAWDLVIGRNDPHDTFVLLHHDERGTGRVFDLRFDGGRWEAARADPDFHQRIVGDVGADRIELARTPRRRRRDVAQGPRSDLRTPCLTVTSRTPTNRSRCATADHPAPAL